ncbi:hypothetical protein CAPTEDRAFT_209634, partial [Capitella teleta]
MAEPFLMEVPQDALTNSTLPSTLTTPSETRVTYAYLIAGIVTMTAGFAFSWMFMLKTPRIFLEKSQIINKNVKDAMPDPLESVNKVSYGMFLACLASMFTVHCAVEHGYSVYLLTFAIKHLNWSKKKSADVTAALMGAFAAGRALGIPLVTILRPSVIMLLDLISMVSMLTMLCAYVDECQSVLW